MQDQITNPKITRRSYNGTIHLIFSTTKKNSNLRSNLQWKRYLGFAKYSSTQSPLPRTFETSMRIQQATERVHSPWSPLNNTHSDFYRLKYQLPYSGNREDKVTKAHPRYVTCEIVYQQNARAFRCAFALSFIHCCSFLHKKDVKRNPRHCNL